MVFGRIHKSALHATTPIAPNTAISEIYISKTLGAVRQPVLVHWLPMTEKSGRNEKCIPAWACANSQFDGLDKPMNESQLAIFVVAEMGATRTAITMIARAVLNAHNNDRNADEIVFITTAPEAVEAGELYHTKSSLGGIPAGHLTRARKQVDRGILPNPLS
jgi:hypothetical protein